MLFYCFLIVDDFKPCVLHGLQDSVAVHGSGTQMSGNFFFVTSTCDGSMGSLTSRWGSLLLFPDPCFPPSCPPHPLRDYDTAVLALIVYIYIALTVYTLNYDMYN